MESTRVRRAIYGSATLVHVHSILASHFNPFHPADQYGTTPVRRTSPVGTPLRPAEYGRSVITEVPTLTVRAGTGLPTAPKPIVSH